MTLAKTKVVTKRLAPNMAPRERNIPPALDPLEALKDAKTSGAPLAKARRVTPARVSEKPNRSAIFSRAGAR